MLFILDQVVTASHPVNSAISKMKIWKVLNKNMLSEKVGSRIIVIWKVLINNKLSDKVRSRMIVIWFFVDLIHFV
jgi:hypothetical protein